MATISPLYEQTRESKVEMWTCSCRAEKRGYAALVEDVGVGALGWSKKNFFFGGNRVVKIRLQQQRGLSTELLRYKGPIHCARMIVREEGILGLWAGAAPTVMRNGTNQAAMFTAKNAFDTMLWKKHEGDGKVLQPWQSMISGFLAGTAGPICTGPFDVVKTRLMAQSKSGGELKYRGMFHAIATIHAEEGLRALWKGLIPRLMRIPPGQAIMWAVADQITGFYERTYLTNAPL
ncbi:Mitochondrial succinate-fumarate transporter [Datura stramonium]|uniref:Mitochondrial succinate-fumarate transporter n=1 Tax=Datura stramonium TaxID=4076 RepID=A0ABS8T3U5_DATST|nr:Mitochondrial succinate-fumarate transporter [Datura stramonium]